MLHRLDFSQPVPQLEQAEDLRFAELPFRDGQNALEKHLEDLIADNISLIDENGDDETLLVIGRQVRTSSGKIMDLIAIDNTGALTLIEVKRDADDIRRRKDHAEIQAVRYAASLAKLKTLEELVLHLFSPYIARFETLTIEERGRRSTEEWARKKLADFLGDNNVADDRINHSQNIVLVGAGFDDDTVSAAAWLASNGVPMRVVEIKPCKIADHFCLDVQQLIPVPAYDDFYVGLDERLGSRLQSNTKKQKKVSDSNRLRVRDIFEAEMIKAGDELFVRGESDKVAVLLDHKYCEYQGRKFTLSQWAKAVKDWSGMNVYDWVVHMPSGRLLGDFREELESQRFDTDTVEDAIPVSLEQPLS